jgi:beta-galactosidase GanA
MDFPIPAAPPDFSTSGDAAPSSSDPYAEPILIGASWYPEMWDASEWPKDVARMQELGFRIVRLFEFAWKRMEPQKGVFDFRWAQEVLDLCHAAGIRVMIGTPSAAPPAWLTETYPEVLQIKPDGRVATHGQRKHFNHHSRRYRAFCERIVEEMARALGDHPAVHSWQIDNEMSGSDYGPETRTRFHDWLKVRFGTIEGLNEAWGLQFWSQAYDRFEQIPMVTAAVGTIEVPERHHPSLLMAQARFQNDGWTEFIALQCACIRRFSDRPITSNMTESPGMHWYQHNKVLDAVGVSCYKDLDHYNWTLYIFERMRREKARPYWLLETAPNWSAGGRTWNIHMHGEGLRCMSWLSLLLGGSMILYWQWRQHWAGQEMLHGTLVTAAGEFRPGVDAHRQLCAEVAGQESWLQASRVAPAEVAVLYSNEAAWALSIDPHDDGVVYNKVWRDDFYLPLVEDHIWRDVINETMDFSPYRLLILPILPLLREDTRKRLAEWVEAGGMLLVGPMTGTRTEEMTIWRDRVFGGFEDLFGAEGLGGFSPKWMEDRITLIGESFPTSHPRIWCEGYRPRTAHALAHYRGGYGDGHAAVVERVFPSGGRVIACGTFPDRTLYLHLVHRLMDAAGVKRYSGGDPTALAIPRCDAQGILRGYGIVNIAEKPAHVRLAHSGIDRLTGERFDGDTLLDPLQIALVEITESAS